MPDVEVAIGACQLPGILQRVGGAGKVKIEGAVLCRAGAGVVVGAVLVGEKLVGEGRGAGYLPLGTYLQVY